MPSRPPHDGLASGGSKRATGALRLDAPHRPDTVDRSIERHEARKRSPATYRGACAGRTPSAISRKHAAISAGAFSSAMRAPRSNHARASRSSAASTHSASARSRQHGVDDAVDRLDDDRMVELSRPAERSRQVGRADEDAVEAVRVEDLGDVLQRLRVLDLHDQRDARARRASRWSATGRSAVAARRAWRARSCDVRRAGSAVSAAARRTVAAGVTCGHDDAVSRRRRARAGCRGSRRR